MLSGLNPKVDPLVSDLLSSLQGSEGGVREAILSALKGVLKHAGKNVSSAVRSRIYSVLKDLIHHDGDRVRMYAASILGMLTQYLEADQFTELIQELSSLANSPNWPPRHGSILTISSLLYHNPAPVFSSSLFPTIVGCLRSGNSQDCVAVIIALIIGIALGTIHKSYLGHLAHIKELAELPMIQLAEHLASEHGHVEKGSRDTSHLASTLDWRGT